MNKNETIAILGPGKVGTALGYLLKKVGYQIVAVAGRKMERVQQAVQYTGGVPLTDLAAAARKAQVIFITVSDDAIASVCETVCAGGAISEGKKVVHVSGAGGLSLLTPAKERGAFTASLHPLQSFAHVEGAIKNLPGSIFALTCDEEIKQWAEHLILAIGGKPFFLADEDKPLYHLSACFASNYLTTLVHLTIQILKVLGLEEKQAREALWPLILGTLKNIEEKGTTQALTGPIARGDVGTIEKHLKALTAKLPHLLPLYRLLGEETVALGKQKGTLSEGKGQLILRLLKGEEP